MKLSKMSTPFLCFAVSTCVVFFVAFPVQKSHAQQSLSLSVTPPFSQIIVKPGDVVRSYLKVINPNPYELTVYATPVNFATGDESGQPKFVPLLNDPVDKTTFAGWIDTTKEAVVIPPESSKDVPYTINVPDNAPPGGHFAAILIGTRPPEGVAAHDGGVIKTSQVVSSLFLARVAGQVEESGQIREFSVADSFSGNPRADFVLRFENAGNVYVQPQGDITIYNMWGTERGFIPINQKSNFGNVLPKSIRKFLFAWEGTPSLTDIGRYKAIATLTYGVDARQSVDRTLYFWVIPLKATLITLALLVGVALFIVFAIRLYIRRVLSMAGIEQRPVPVTDARPSRAQPRVSHKVTRAEIVAPLKAGVLDLRKSVSARASGDTRPAGLVEFFISYRSFCISLVIGCIGIGLVVWYVVDARGANRPYEVTMRGESGSAITLHSKDTENAHSTSADTKVLPSTQTGVKQRVSIVNASGKTGASSLYVARLEKEGFSIGDISTDQDTRQKSVIVYNAQKLADAKKISEYFDGVSLSVRAYKEETDPEILLIIGADYRE